MANLSAYLNFSIVLDSSVTPAKVRFTDNSNYPVGVAENITGSIEITQPDGIITPGTVYWSGGQLISPELEYRMNTQGQPQNGAWKVRYLAQHPSYDDTVLERIFSLQYTEPNGVLSPNLNVFTPILIVTDGTVYSVAGMTLQNVTRSWTGEVGSLGSIGAGDTPNFDLNLSGTYYDADYVITLDAIADWLINDAAWVTVRDKIIKDSSFSVDTPPTLEALLLSLNEFKTATDLANSCNSDCGTLDYVYAESLYNHILKRGCYGQTSGLDAYIKELVKVLNGGVTPEYVNTELALAAYVWTTPCSGGGGGEANTGENVGSGQGVFANKTGITLNFKTLVAGSGVTLTPSPTEIVIASSSTGEANTGSNVGDTGEGIYAGKAGVALLFRKLMGGTGISLALGGSGEIVISANSIGEVNVGQNVGSGTGVYKTKSGATLQFKTLKAGTNVTLDNTTNPDEIVINATAGAGGEVNTASNVGATGVGVYKQKSAANLEFRKLVGGAGVKVELLPLPNDEIAITGPGMTNVGTGVNLYKEYDLTTNTHRFRKLKAGSNVGISIVDDDIIITAAGGGGGGGSLPLGGTPGQLLTKNSEVDGDASWQDPAPVEQIILVSGTAYA
jgi:hypothetical protein